MGVMTRISAEAPGDRLYRPGVPFADGELQSLEAEGALRRLLGDVYVARSVPHSAGLRAAAVCTMLSPTEASDVVLCGEAAAWVHLGRPRPTRLTVVSSRFRRTRRGDVLARQSHQIRLDDSDWESLGELRLTTAVRTAADLCLGVGTVGQADFVTDETHDQERRGMIAALLDAVPDRSGPRRVEDVIAWQLSLRGETADRSQIARTLERCLR